MRNLRFILIIVLAIFIFSCEEENKGVFDGSITTGETPQIDSLSIIEIGDKAVTVIPRVNTEIGIGNIVKIGVCWDTLTEPTKSTNNYKEIDIKPDVSIEISGLTPRTQYHIRPYIITKAETVYYEPVPVKTKGVATLFSYKPTNVSSTSFSISGKVEDDGGDTLLVCGSCWHTEPNPTIELETKMISSLTDSAFISNIAELDPLNNHYVRVFVTNSYGTAYGDEFRVGRPAVITQEVGSVTSSSAIVKGLVRDDGCADVSSQGAVYSKTENPTLEAGIKVLFESETIVGEDFQVQINELEPGVQYHVRAFAVNSAGVSYGDLLTFTTGISLPLISTNTVTDITSSSAISGGVVESDGGTAILATGIVWSKLKEPTIDLDTKTVNGMGTKSFVSSINDLEPATLYYVRAYATNILGTVYGNQISFTTKSTIPTVFTANIIEITSTSATSGGIIQSNGGTQITAYGLCWSVNPHPTTTDNKTTGVLDSNNRFISFLTGLTPGTTYYVRAFATNENGTAYGDEASFTTEAIGATLTTTAITEITHNSAVGGGNITDDGGATITARGVCWSTNENPTTNDSKTTNGTGKGSFTSSITNLRPGKTYYVRAYAVNSSGTSYGNQVNFKTKAVLPTLSTSNVSSITATTAISGGNITDDGGASITARGVCWSTNENPTTRYFKTTNGTGVGEFSSNLTNLTHATTYYVRAYATNSVGTSYGSQVSFTTNPIGATLSTTTITEITHNSAVGGGNITDDGGASITARGVCWSLNESPTTNDSKTTDGTDKGSFTSSITNLQSGKTYYVRAYATNSAGTSYGSQVNFKTKAVLPTLSTSNVSSITATTAISGGNITDDGGATITARGVCWSTNESPTTSDSKTTNSTGSGMFSSNLINLTHATTYYVRAYATNSVGTSYGNQMSFTTSPIGATLTTTTITEITDHSAVGGGNITDDGGAEITARGICWSTNENPTISDAKTTNGTSKGSFTSSISNLQPGKTYYVRAYAVNSSGTSYGNQVNFKTNAILPTISTTNIRSITASSAISGGNVTDDGGATITARGVCWSLNENPTTSDSKTTNGTGKGSFTSSITNLQPGNTYYVRAYATNSIGTTYGMELSMITKIEDIDGNAYSVVKIGEQKWMAENLRVTKFRDGNNITHQQDKTSWWVLAQTPQYCYYNNDELNSDTRGLLYNWRAVETDLLCPAGWHIPSDEDWTQLENYLANNGYNYDGSIGGRGNKIGKAIASDTLWYTSNILGAIGNTDYPEMRNKSGFYALPGGQRSSTGVFFGFSDEGYWWTSTRKDSSNAILRNLFSNSAELKSDYSSVVCGLSVRCIKY